MLRLSAGSWRLSGIANSRSTGQRQQNTDDRNCSDDNAERSTSADWRTTDADDQQRRRLVCSCSPGKAEPFHEETDTGLKPPAFVQHGELESSQKSRKTSTNYRGSGPVDRIVRMQSADAASTGRCCMCTHQMAALFHVQWHHDHHLESMMSYQKSNCVNRCISTWRTFPPNFIPILFETTEP